MPIAPHLALMPDIHLGKGMPIGGVLPLVNAISPNCVGVDIGCGLLAVKTDLTEINTKTLGKKVLNINECVATMQDMGLKCDAGRFALDEAKEAYKDINHVMGNQNDLVEILVELRPYKYPAIKG